MLIGIFTSPCVVSTKKAMVQLQNDLKIVGTLELYKNHLLVFSLRLIAILVTGINGGVFPAI